MTRLAVEAGVDVLAHTPFTELVDDVLIARAVRDGTAMDLDARRDRATATSTPDAERALDNLRRFRAAGGTRALRHRPRQRRRSRSA